jgi:hypothetical protein
MTGVVAFNRFGPDSYTVSPAATNNLIDGGLLVMPDAANPGTILPATAGALNVLGVTLQPTANSAFNSQSTPLYGGNATDISIPVENAAVAWQGTYKLTFAAPAVFGELLAAAANGQVEPIAVGGSAGTAGRTVTDGVTTLGSTVVTSATGAFTTADLGRTVTAAGIPAGATITGINSSTSIDISLAATATASSVSIVFGTLVGEPAAAAGNIVGICVQPGGVAAGSAGLVRLRL